MVKKLGRRFGMLRRGEQFDRDLEEEMRLHRQLKEEELVAGGMAQAQAHDAAQRQFGNTAWLQEESRAMWRWIAFDHLLQDMRYGLRVLRKDAGFTAVVVLTLALGIGANTAMFSVVNSVLLRPLPYNHPQQLVELWPSKPLTSVSKVEYAALRGQMHTLQDLAAYSTWLFTITGGGEPEELKGARTTASCLSLLGAQPLLGRTFLPGEDQPGRSNVVILSYGLWQRRFSGDAQVIGRTVVLDGTINTIVGVMPPTFNFPAEHLELWQPLSLDPHNQQDFAAGYMNLVGRLQPDATPQQARAELAAIAQRLPGQIPGLPPQYGKETVVGPLQEGMVGDVRARLLVLFGAVGLILLIACANVANLQLARSAGRHKEMAIRAASGASRARLLRQLLTESMVLALAGGGAGVLLAFGLKNFLVANLPADTPRLGEIGIDLRVLAFALAAALLTGVFFGLTPALRLSRSAPVDALKEGGRTVDPSIHSLYRNGLATLEVALALMLVIGAGLLIKSFSHLQSVHLGFTPENVLSMRLAPPDARYDTPPRKVAFYRQLLERISGLPGVVSAGAINLLPLGARNWTFTMDIEGRPVAPGAPRPRADFRLVTADYFQTVRIPLIRGRYFATLDKETAPPVAIINESMAREYWPHENALGRRISNDGKEWATIVGVVADVKDRNLAQGPRAELYRPYVQVPWIASLTIMIRSNSDAAALASSIRGVVWAMDKDVPVADVQRLSDVVSSSVSGPRATMLLMAAFAAVALMLGIIGVYGVLAYSVAQRTHEIGIRMSLGAQRADVLRLVMGRGFALIGAGVGAGLLGSLAVTRIAASLLFGVSATDPEVFAVAALLLAAAAACATYLPARSAMRADPMAALRYQ